MKVFCINNFVVDLISNNFVILENFVEFKVNEIFENNCNVVIVAQF